MEHDIGSSERAVMDFDRCRQERVVGHYSGRVQTFQNGGGGLPEAAFERAVADGEAGGLEQLWAARRAWPRRRATMPSVPTPARFSSPRTCQAAAVAPLASALAPSQRKVSFHDNRRGA